MLLKEWKNSTNSLRSRKIEYPICPAEALVKEDIQVKNLRNTQIREYSIKDWKVQSDGNRKSSDGTSTTTVFYYPYYATIADYGFITGPFRKQFWINAFDAEISDKVTGVASSYILLLFLIDLPFSALLDTLLLPYDLISQDRYNNNLKKAKEANKINAPNPSGVGPEI